MDLRITDQLIEDIRLNHDGAFRKLIDQTQRYAYETAYRITRSPEDSRDIVQEAYIRIWKNIEKFDSKGSFKYWFHSILRNLSIDWLRKQAVQNSKPVRSSEIPDRQSDGSGPDTLLERDEVNLLIRSWLPGLPKTQQKIFIMRDLEGLSIKEVEQETGLSGPSIKTNLWLARKKLRELLISNGYH
ncbi:MAG: sigma-70 family RNA polymerase sigma factor [Bacteroidota bacterium]